MFSNFVRIAAAVVVSTSLLAPSAASAQKAKGAHAPITVQWLGHAAFEITSSGGTHILIDPFLSGNPSTPDSLKALSRYKPAAILVSHSHSDHALDAKAIAMSSGAMVISAYEWVNTLGLPEKQAMGGNVGGTFKVGDVTVHIVPAMHSSDPGGRPVGFVLEFADGRTLYHTGDTWLFGDMALIQELYHPNIVLIGAGGGPYTQGPADARREIAKYFTPQVIVPMHYGTFPGLATEAQVRAGFAGDKRLQVMKAGESRTF
jgi:L-ascorbate metabolism protein UlaG (beta-lactamase superfamily)